MKVTDSCMFIFIEFSWTFILLLIANNVILLYMPNRHHTQIMTILYFFIDYYISLFFLYLQPPIKCWRLVVIIGILFLFLTLMGVFLVFHYQIWSLIKYIPSKSLWWTHPNVTPHHTHTMSHTFVSSPSLEYA